MYYTSPWSRFELTTSVVKGTDCIGSCKSSYHTIMATTSPSHRTKTNKTKNTTSYRPSSRHRTKTNKTKNTTSYRYLKRRSHQQPSRTFFRKTDFVTSPIIKRYAYDISENGINIRLTYLNKQYLVQYDSEGKINYLI
jgi:hypothetical protein